MRHALMNQSCREAEVGLDEWVFIPAENRARALPEDRNLGNHKKDAVFDEITVDLNYFVCPLVKEKATSGSCKQVIIPQPARLTSDSTEAMNAEEAEDLHESKDVGIVVKSPEVFVIHHDVLYAQVLIKKLIDVKVDSLESSRREAALMAPHLEPEKVQSIEGEEQGAMLLEEKEYDSTGSQAKDGFGLVVCNRRLTGIGAFFSMGAAAAAATICILIVGGRQHQKQQQEQQKIRLNMYTNNKRTKEAVQQALLAEGSTHGQQGSHLVWGSLCCCSIGSENIGLDERVYRMEEIDNIK